MGLVRRVLTSFLEDEAGDAQMFQKADGSFWTRATDGTETAVGGGGSQPAWDQSGAGSPLGSVTPSQTGARYEDLTHGTLWIAVGPDNDDWVAVGGWSDGSGTPPIGFTTSLVAGDPATAGAEVIGANTAAGGGVGLTDQYSFVNTGAGIYWITDGTVDGQVLSFDRPGDGITVLRMDKRGLLLPHLPTADPHVVDQLWNSAGTLKISAG